MPTQEALILLQERGKRTEVLATITDLSKDRVALYFEAAKKRGMRISIVLRRKPCMRAT